MKVKDRIKSFRRVKAGDLLPNPKNWRVHPATQANALRGILAEVGWADAVLARETDEGLMLIDGHLRAEVAPEEKIPVLVLDVTEEEGDKILATLDPLAGLATADAERLESLLGELDFDNEDLQKMLDGLKADAGIKTEPAALEDPEPQIDRAEELLAAWDVKPGQLWEIQGKQTHRLLCGDSTKAEDVAKLLGDVVPFIMVTDPPYGVEYDPEWRDEVLEKLNRRTGNVQGDSSATWTPAYKLFSGHVAYVWHADRHAAELVVNLREAGFGVRTQIIWRKPQIVFGRGHYHWQHEPCWYAVRKGGSAKWCGDRTQSTIWEIQHLVSRAKTNGTADEFTTHGTQKPVECMARPIRNHGGKEDDVYDPFLGSGTTMVAAEQLDRRCYGIELEPKYVAVALERMVALGCKCVLKESGPKKRKGAA